jgi:hypothetical protein
MDIFYAATKITIGNGCKTSFWDAPLLEGRKPKEIAPLTFACSKRKFWKVNIAMEANAWVGKIILDENFTIDHLFQFINLWAKLQEVHLIEEIEDTISWRLTSNGQYSVKSVYDLQFFGSTTSNLYKSVWKVWATPKAKFFAWLLTQNRIWTANRLQKRGWPNCGLCPLCKQETESVCHLFIHCRYVVRLWNLIRVWLGIPGIMPGQWVGLSINNWWNQMTSGATPNRRAIASLSLLVTWEIWAERNARVFHNKHAPPSVMLDKIKREARLWVLAGAKRLGEIMPGE